MVWNYTYGFAATVLLALLAGFPIAVLCGVGRGVRAIGFASACGTSLLLIVCRAVQMISPLAPAEWIVLGALLLAIVAAWSQRPTRVAFSELWQADGRLLCAVLGAAAVVGILLGAPILFGDAIQYEGTRNADSFTFTQSAQYMLGHAFHGAEDFTPEHPIYTISRGYFGDGAMQPRPAAEGLLALMSAWRGVDPMYLYNAVQAAGVMLAGFAALAFLPQGWRARNAADRLLLAVYVVGCPALLHIAANSNFANAFNLPAATAYVALGLLPRTRGTFVAGILFIGCLLSGYPELLVFMAMARGLGVMLEGWKTPAISGVIREAGWMIGELLAACVLLPWAALGAIAVFKTTLGVSREGASELGGNMFAGLPMLAAAIIALGIGWRALGAMPDAGRRWFLAAILVAFGLAQGLMLARGFDYGGFKVSQYFVTLLIGVVLRSVLSPAAGIKLGRAAGAVAVALSILMVVKSADVLRRAWDWSQARRVTPDLVAAGRELARLSHGLPVALGTTPQPFYYGMWVPYVASVPIAFDLIRDANAAGYLSTYLRLAGREQEMLNASQLQLEIDTSTQAGAKPVARFGNVVIRPK
jgi:hypothetical protein